METQEEKNIPSQTNEATEISKDTASAALSENTSDAAHIAPQHQQPASGEVASAARGYSADNFGNKGERAYGTQGTYQSGNRYRGGYGYGDSGSGGYRPRPGAGGAGGGKFGSDRRSGRPDMRREKYDKIAAEKLEIDYKKPEILKRFLTEKGKILSRYITGNSAKNQRKLTREVKRARFIGLLPSA